MNMQVLIISGDLEAVRRRKWLVCFSVTVLSSLCYPTALSHLFVRSL